jgi:hypothetical protein
MIGTHFFDSKLPRVNHLMNLQVLPVIVWHSERERCLVVFRPLELADPHQERRDNTLDILLYLYI